MKITLMMIVSSESTETFIQLTVEGLLNHFFSFRSHYFQEDVSWFLNQANMHMEWCYRQELSFKQCVHASERPSTTITVQTEVSCNHDCIYIVYVYNHYLQTHLLKLSMFKFYLGHILGEWEENGDQQPQYNPLQLFKQQFRLLIGEVLMTNNLGSPGPYMPVFCQAGLPEYLTIKFQEVSL